MKKFIAGLAKSAVQMVSDNYFRWNAADRSLAISEKVIGLAKESAMAKAEGIKEIVISGKASSYEVCVETDKGLKATTEIVPTKIVVDGENASIHAQLPGGIGKIEGIPALVGVGLFFDRVMLGGKGVSKALNKIDGLSLSGSKLVYTRKIEDLPMMNFVSPYLKDGKHVPLSVSDGWLLFTFSDVLPKDARLNWSTLLLKKDRSA